MKPTMAISVCVLAAGLAVAQSPSIVQNTRATMNGVRDNAAAASNAALAGQNTPVASNAAQSSAAPAMANATKGTPLSAHPVHAKKHDHAATAKKAQASKVEPT